MSVPNNIKQTDIWRIYKSENLEQYGNTPEEKKV